MPDSADFLARECAVFARYLAGADATPYLVQVYRRSHATMPALAHGTPDRVDRFLVAVARRGPLAARLADAYARRLRPTGLLRQKLVLACAVLESSPPAHDWLNTAAAGSMAGTALRLLGVGAVSGLATFAGLLLLGPVHLVLAVAGREGGPA